MIPLTDKQLRDQFHTAMVDICMAERNVRPYGGSRLSQWIVLDGGLAAAQKCLQAVPPKYGFMELIRLDHPELTVEALVLQPKWRPLFTHAELAIAQRRLDDVTPGGWK